MLKYKEFINEVLGSDSLNESISNVKLQKVIVDSSFGNLDIASDEKRVKNTKNISIDDFDSLIKKTLGVLSTEILPPGESGSKQFSSVKFDYDGKSRNIVLAGASVGDDGSKTDTDTKESMVVFFYYNQDVDILSMQKSEILKLVLNIPSGVLHPSAIKKIENWLSAFDKKNEYQINQWKSSANKMESFRSAGYDLDRFNILVPIRKKAKDLSGLEYDNWCPADVYLFDPSAKSTILNYIENAKTIGELNLLFLDTFSP
jgi:hypothetical protein